ncbi:tripartite tricarboxylate transporter substrate binding protein [Variovorax sp. KK3]|uniref:Bug family tripartite tricarboxylate transporter substrate binding protein n=1 Tax=Variovorax sp. KK3 TaxID=1855728 RepID=UPI0009FACC75|nr:tripartite tricarboxylate transporter substrate binding protein [Variovorax sp. KK3]
MQAHDTPMTRRDALATLAVTVGGAVLAARGGSAFAEAGWPSRPIKWVNPYAAGGASDGIVRVVAQKLGERFGQPVVIDNKTGAGGNIGTDFVAKSPPDGYTWIVGNTGPMAVNSTLYGNLSFDPQKDFTPISLVMSYPNLVIANLESGPSSLQDLIARAKSRPVAYAGNGVGTSLHLTGQMLAQAAGIKLTHVAYRGEPPGLTDVMAGVVPVGITPISAGLPLVKGGKVRALAVTGAERSPLLPDVPTASEAGVPGFEANGWIGVLVPRGTPPAVVAKIVKEFTAVMQLPEIQNIVKNDMASVVPPLGPEHFAAFMQSETQRWGQVVRTANVKVE